MTDLPFTSEMTELPYVLFNQRGHQFFGRNYYGDPAERTVTVHVTAIPGMEPHYSYLHSFSCSYCGGFPRFTVQEDGKHVASTVCDSTDLTTTVQIAIPSGRMVANDSLWDVFQQPDDSELALDIDSAAGRVLWMEACAKQAQVAYFVAYHSPHLFVNPDRTEMIVYAGDYDYETDEMVPPEGDWTEVGQVSTGLWAVSVADADRYRTAGGDIETERYGFNVVDVAPGIWDFTYLADQAGVDRDDPGIIGHAKLVTT